MRGECHSLARVVLVALAAVITIVAVSALTGTAVADKHNATIERTDGELEVSVNESLLDGETPVEISVTIGEGNDSRSVEPFPEEETLEPGDSTYNISVSNISAGQNLSEAEVAVSIDSEKIDSDQVDLRLLELEDGSEAEIAPNGRIVVEANEIAGLEPDDVDVRVDQDGTAQTEDWSLEQRPDGWVVTGNVRVLSQQSDFDLFDRLNVTVEPADEPLRNQLSFDPRDIAVGPVASTDDDETVLAHALFFDEEVLIQVETTDPEGRYVTTTIPRNGEITVPRRLVFAGDLNVTVTHTADDTVVFENRNISVETQATTATVENGTLTVAAEEPFSNATTVWLQKNESVYRLSDESVLNDTTLDVSNISATLDGTVKVVAFGDSVSRLQLTVSQSSPSQTGGANTNEVDSGPDNKPGDEQQRLKMEIKPVIQGGLVGTILLVMLVWLVISKLGVAGKIQTAVSALGLLSVHGLTLATLIYSFIIFEPMPVGEFLGTAVVVAALLIGLWAVLARRRTGPGGSRDYMLGVAVVSILVGVGLVALWHFKPYPYPQGALMAGALYGLFATSITAYPLTRRGGESESSESTAGGATSSTREPVDVTVSVYDSVTNKPLDDVEIRYDGPDGIREGGGPVEVSSGQATLSVKRGQRWKFTAVTGDRQQASVTEKVDNLTGGIRIEFPGHDLRVAVQTEGGDPIDGATVTIDDGSNDVTLDAKGGTLREKFPVDTDEIEVTAEHDLYGERTKTVDVRRQSRVDFRLPPRTGRLDVSAKLNGRGVADVDVTARRRGELERTYTGKTDDRGQATFSDVLVGEYQITATLPVDSEAFIVSSTTATVAENDRESERLHITFEHSLSSGQHDRIRDLRDRLDEIATSSRRDDAIQTYYSSALHSVLDELENIPRAAYEFFEYGRDPDEVVDAILEATETAVETIDDVLSSKRNVDLFSACSGLPDANVRYNERVDIVEVLEIADKDVGDQRAAFTDRLEAVDDHITDELRDLAEVSPAREMWEGTRDMVRDQGGLSRVETAASMFVADLLLDVIESLFEQPQLRKRMEQSVY